MHRWITQHYQHEANSVRRESYSILDLNEQAMQTKAILSYAHHSQSSFYGESGSVLRKIYRSILQVVTGREKCRLFFTERFEKTQYLLNERSQALYYFLMFMGFPEEKLYDLAQRIQEEHSAHASIPGETSEWFRYEIHPVMFEEETDGDEHFPQSPTGEYQLVRVSTFQKDKDELTVVLAETSGFSEGSQRRLFNMEVDNPATIVTALLDARVKCQTVTIVANRNGGKAMDDAYLRTIFELPALLIRNNTSYLYSDHSEFPSLHGDYSFVTWLMGLLQDNLGRTELFTFTFLQRGHIVLSTFDKRRQSFVRLITINPVGFRIEEGLQLPRRSKSGKLSSKGAAVLLEDENNPIFSILQEQEAQLVDNLLGLEAGYKVSTVLDHFRTIPLADGNYRRLTVFLDRSHHRIQSAKHWNIFNVETGEMIDQVPIARNAKIKK